MSPRRSFLADVSWLQMLAGVAAAALSAWVASSLGVAGTVIGAAVGSAVVTISSAFFNRTLDHGRTLIVETDLGSVVTRRTDGDTTVAVADEAEQRPTRRIRWKVVAASFAVVLVLTLGVISAIEAVTGTAFDGSDGTTIGQTFGQGGGRQDDGGPTGTSDDATTATTDAPDEDEATTEPTAEATTEPTEDPTAVPTTQPTATIPTEPQGTVETPR